LPEVGVVVVQPVHTALAVAVLEVIENSQASH
jgi:hypothetical protein